MKKSPFTVMEANETSHGAAGRIHCNKTSFEGVDPIPGEAKACYCDTKPVFDDTYMEKVIKYWRLKKEKAAAAKALIKKQAEAK